jgi:EAL domain-containing protein (putative c-di-GMP-specific phosphodiesterase class I)
MLKQRPNYSIMVNLSGLHLMDEDFSNDFIVLAKSFDMPLEKLHLEVTEGIFMDDKERAIRTMAILRQAGIKFALDDFGTGYSSLSYLQKLPINYLKIDKSFVAGMLDAQSDMSIVKNIIMLAHTLGLQVIAEGVETESQFSALADMGCDYFQGWLCGRPGPFPAI